MVLVLKILGGIAALLLGIWLGLPGRYTQSSEEIEHAMELGGGRRRKVKRTFTPLAWIQRKAGASRNRSHHRGHGFDLERPEDR